MEAISTKVKNIKAGKKTKMIKDFKNICEVGDCDRGYFSLIFIHKEQPQRMEMKKKRRMKPTKRNSILKIYNAK